MVLNPREDFPRQALATLRSYGETFRIVALTGPRQAGKTTLTRLAFPDKPYANLEDPDTLDLARSDPRRFLRAFPDGAVLDEVQRCPGLFSYLQGIVDVDQRRGLFILAGSQDFLLQRAIAQSLAGRVGLLTLLPLGVDELARAGRLPATWDEAIFQGGFPEIHAHGINAQAFHMSYLATYLERDLRDLLAVHDLALFQRFLRLCAGHGAQLINASALGAACGVSYKTVQSWLGVLQTSGLVLLLQPHHRNFTKRLVKTPKLYFTDTGLACRLLGIADPTQVAIHPLRGALAETWVVTEFLKSRRHRGLDPALAFWRNHAGLEVDLIVDHGMTLLPIEIKSGETLRPEWEDGLCAWSALAGAEAEPGILVHGGDRAAELPGGSTAVSWRDLPRVLARA